MISPHFTGENQFLTYAYCINHRAEQATRNGYNHVIMRIYKIGQSAQGEDLIAVEMWAENEDDDEVKEYDEMPESRLMGNIHGNEDQGVFILMPLINEYSIATSTYSVRGSQVQFHLWTNCDCRFRTLIEPTEKTRSTALASVFS